MKKLFPKIQDFQVLGIGMIFSKAFHKTYRGISWAAFLVLKKVNSKGNFWGFLGAFTPTHLKEGKEFWEKDISLFLPGENPVELFETILRFGLNLKPQIHGFCFWNSGQQFLFII